MNLSIFFALRIRLACNHHVALQLPSLLSLQCHYWLFSQTRAPHSSVLFLRHRKSRFQKQSLAGRTRERKTFYLSLKSKKDSFTPLLALPRLVPPFLCKLG